MKKIFLAAALIAALLLLFSGCAAGEPETSPLPEDEDTTPLPEDIEETLVTVNVEGSDYVAKLVDGLAQTYMQANEGVSIEVLDTSSNFGIAALAKDEADIALSSRTLKESEKTVFPGMKETVLCMDGIAVIVNAGSPVGSLTPEQVKDIFTGKIKDWNEVGGAAGEITVYTMSSDTEVRKIFNSLFLGADEQGNQIDTDDYENFAVESGEEMIAALLEDGTAIGYVPLSEIAGNTVKTVSIDGVAASADNIKSGSYPYVLDHILMTTDPSDEAKAFLDYIKGAEAKAYIITQRLIVQ